MVGRIAPWKGQDIFLRAFARAFPKGEERCVLVGAPLFGETDYEISLHRLAEELGIASRTEFRGFRTDVWAELSRMDALVHASVTPEPFGQVILEAMAAGVPVIATDAGGPAEIIEHNKTGVLYPAADVERLASHMRRLQTDPAERERVSRNAREAVRAYEPGGVAARLHELYRSTLAKKGHKLLARWRP
jgi:glycosyltransferase involved in cell wall biosynthesis